MPGALLEVDMPPLRAGCVRAGMCSGALLEAAVMAAAAAAVCGFEEWCSVAFSATADRRTVHLLTGCLCVDSVAFEALVSAVTTASRGWSGAVT
jgi:hypothetical protein